MFGIVSELSRREGGGQGKCHGVGLGREAVALRDEAGGVVEGGRECPVIQVSKTLKTRNWASPSPLPAVPRLLPRFHQAPFVLEPEQLPERRRTSRPS